MKDRDTEDTTNQNHSLLVKTQSDTDLFLNSAEIDDVLRRLCTFFSDRVGLANREMLSFCLRHIFYNIDQMYTFFLPELTECTLGKAKTEQQQRPRIHTMPLRNMPVQNLTIQYHIWSLLQEIEASLERLEPLCQLIISATTTMLNELDRTCSIKSKRVGPGEKEAPSYHAQENRMPHQDQQENGSEWQGGLVQIREKTSIWLKSLETQIPFSVQFAILAPMIPALSQMDVALALLLKSAYAIFRDILPAFQETGTDDDKVTPLFLDISQRCDQMVLQIGVLVEPLHILTDQYTLETPIQ
jgi:hypothetical protein